MKALTNIRLISGNEIYEGKTLRFDTKIAEWADAPADGDIVIDGKGLYCSAGFIDQHIHGYNGIDTMDASVEQLLDNAQRLAKNGVTAFLPTTMTMGKDKIHAAFETIRKAKEAQSSGAHIVGCHMEGPFINIEKKGAQNPDYILSPDFSLIEPYKDVVKMVTYAPENDPDHTFARALKAEGISASVGHTTADYDTAKAAYLAGADNTTHFFNAMPALTHRAPGVIGAALENPNVYIELIADTIHVHPALFEMLYRVKGDHLILITDAIEACDLSDGQYSLGGLPVTVKDGAARLSDGTLAGSTLKMNEAVKNVWKNTSLSLPQAISLATRNPAAHLGLTHKGDITPDMDADIILFDDELTIHRTFCRGK